MKVFRGRLVHSLNPEKIEIIEDAVIGYSEENGQILFFEKDGSNFEQLMKKYGFHNTDVQTLTKSQFLMPGFVDSHVHPATYQMTKVRNETSLIKWLINDVYPLEQDFSDIKLAHSKYDEIVSSTLCCGTTTANYFTTIYLESTKELCQVVGKQGLRAFVGKVNMDTHSGKYGETTESSVKDTLAFIDFVKEMKNPLIQPVITPRNLLSCTESLLTQLAKIAADNGLHIQSFLCEDEEEIKYTLTECHKGHSCTEIMDRVGLLNNKSLMVNASFLKEDEVQLLKERDSSIVYCPITTHSQEVYVNIHDRLLKGLKVALGTGFCWGVSSTSILDVIKAARNKSMEINETFKKEKNKSKALTIDELFYMATLGGAKALSIEDEIGNFKVNKQFDALLVDVLTDRLSSKDIVEYFLYKGNVNTMIMKVFVAGKNVVDKEEKQDILGKLIMYNSQEDSNCQEIIEDIYEKYSQEDGVIPFKAVKGILIGPPQVGKTTTKMRLLKQIENIQSEGGNIKPDSTGLEKPVEVMSATMISTNEADNSLYWKALTESQLGQALMCYINSQPTSAIESLSQTHKQSETLDCIDTMSTELTAFAQNNEDSSEEHLSLQSRKRSHTFDSTDTNLKKRACSFENDDKLFSQYCKPCHMSDKEQLLIFQSRKRSHSSDSIADTMNKKQATSIDSENDENEFASNSKESLDYSATESEQTEESDNMEIEHTTLLLRKERHISSIVMNFIKKQCNDKDFLNLFKELKDSVSSSTSIYITDTGGQPEFLRFLPLILSKPAFYFVFFSLGQKLDRAYSVKFTKDGETQKLYYSTQTVKDILSQLLSSLHIPTSSDEKYSKVKSRALLFGTNADCPYKDLDEINDELKAMLPSDSNYVTTVESKFKTVFIPVNNMSGTDEIISIRQYLEELVNDIDPVNIPVRWLIFHLLLRKRFKEAKVCSLEDCEQLAKECFIAKHHVQDILIYIHQNLGTILYYRDIDKNVIVCNPDVLLKIISELVVVSVTQSTRDTFTEVSTHGEIHEESINSLMMDDKKTYGNLNAQYVIKVMTHFQLITMLTERDGIHSTVHNSAPLFAPSLLRPDHNNSLGPTNRDICTTLLVSFGNDEMPPHLFQNLIVALRAQSIEMKKKEPRLMWSLSHCHYRFSDHIYFKVSYADEEWFVELMLRKLETAYIEVRCEPTTSASIIRESIQHILYLNIKTTLQLVCNIFDHTRHLKPIYGVYCKSATSLHLSKFNEEKCTFLCEDSGCCDCDKSEAISWFLPSEKMEDVKTKDTVVQFDYVLSLLENLPNAYVAGQKLFVIQGDHSQSFNWNECGLQLSCPQGALTSSDERCEVAIVALAGGQFKLPVGTKLVSAVYVISVSKPLLKPLSLELQHCVALETKIQADSLKFVRAPFIECDSNAEFTIFKGGKFYPGSWYGSITLQQFSGVGIVDTVTEQSAYFCKVFYEKIASLEWIVKLIIVRRLKALEEYMSTRHPQAIEYSLTTVLPSRNSFKFIFDNPSQQLPKGWSIYRQDSNSEFEYNFIDKFVSDELPEPPSCSMIIKAKQDPSTEEVFYYPVPLDGVSKEQQIFIYLSLESSLVTEPSIKVSDAEKAGKIAQGILRKHFDSLGGLLHRDPLQEVARGMYAAGLVSISINNSPDYNNLMKEFNIMLGLCRDLPQFRKHCQEFLTILSGQDGPLKAISEVIANEWDKEIKDQLRVNFNFADELT